MLQQCLLVSVCGTQIFDRSSSVMWSRDVIPSKHASSIKNAARVHIRAYVYKKNTTFFSQPVCYDTRSRLKFISVNDIVENFRTKSNTEKFYGIKYLTNSYLLRFRSTTTASIGTSSTSLSHARRFKGRDNSASSSVTSEGTLTPDIIQDISAVPFSDDGETSSVYSCDTEGYYTSFHVDSGLKTLREEEPPMPQSPLTKSNEVQSDPTSPMMENEYELFGRGSTSTTTSSAGTVCTTLMAPPPPERKSSLTVVAMVSFTLILCHPLENGTKILNLLFFNYRFTGKNKTAVSHRIVGTTLPLRPSSPLLVRPVPADPAPSSSTRSRATSRAANESRESVLRLPSTLAVYPRCASSHLQAPMTSTTLITIVIITKNIITPRIRSRRRTETRVQDLFSCPPPLEPPRWRSSMDRTRIFMLRSRLSGLQRARITTSRKVIYFVL